MRWQKFLVHCGAEKIVKTSVQLPISRIHFPLNPISPKCSRWTKTVILRRICTGIYYGNPGNRVPRSRAFRTKLKGKPNFDNNKKDLKSPHMRSAAH